MTGPSAAAQAYPPTARHAPRHVTLLILAGCLSLFTTLFPTPSHAWGAEGHRVVALVAERYLRPETQRRIDAILATDPGPRATDLAYQATWADRWREDDPDGHRTASWHYVNLELVHPSMRWACWGHRPLPAGTPASQGPSHSCAVDKIDQFEAELAAPGTPPRERLLALRFVLHLVGDLHQPLHAADNHDHGGNDVRVLGISRRPTTLHRAWDTVLVHRLGRSPRQIAQRLVKTITPVDRQRWQRGTPTDWAWQAWRMACDDAYGKLPRRSRRAAVTLDAAYARQATADIRLQLSRAGVRLAWMLNRALDGNGS
ncbi:MAG TPA: S1/P1 nuclease [Nevskiaceae bacterium]